MTDYQIVDRKDRRKLVEFLSDEGDMLVPLLEMIETAELGFNALIDVIGRAGIEALLMISACQVAANKQPGKKPDGNAIGWHGSVGSRLAWTKPPSYRTKPALPRLSGNVRSTLDYFSS